MADVDTLLDFDSPSVSSQPMASSFSASATDPFGMDAFDDFTTSSSVREGEPSLLFDDFDPLGPSRSVTVTTTTTTVVGDTSTVTADRSTADNDRFSDLLGDFDSTNHHHQPTDVDQRDDLYDDDDGHDRDEEAVVDSRTYSHYSDEEYQYATSNNDVNYVDNGVTAQEDEVEEAWQHPSDNHTVNDDVSDECEDAEPESRPAPVADWIRSEPRSDFDQRPGHVVQTSPVVKNTPQSFQRRPPTEKVISDDGSCRQCGKRVYEMEKLTADEVVYHKSCFRCAHCNRVLSLMSYSVLDGQVFCKPHFLEIFKMKGKYEAGVVPLKGVVKSGSIDGDDDYLRNRLSGSSPLPRRDLSHDGDSDDETYHYANHENTEEIPSVPIRHVRNIFENLSQNTQTHSPPVTTKRTSKWDKPVEKSPSGDLDHVDAKRVASVAACAPVSEQRRRSVRDDDDGDREVVQGSSTVYVHNEELPPPAMTRSILAKFREMESSSQQVVVPTPGRSSRTSSVSSGPRSSAVRSEDGKKVQKMEHEHSQDDYSPERNQPRGSVISSSGHDATDGRRGNSRQLNREDSRSPEPADRDNQPTGDELPQQGLARSLLARWRTIEQQATTSSRGRDETTKRSSASRRSQSTSRIEVRQRSKGSRPVDIDIDGDRSTSPDRVAEYLDVQQNSDDDDQTPHLVTKQVLAKFKNMEAENKMITKQQVPLQRQREDDVVVVEKSFKWEVKEAVPLSRGNLVVHGDVPKKSSSDVERVSSPDYRADELSDTQTSAVRDDELPPPATTRNLLSMFKSLEDPSKAPPTPERAEKSKAALRSSDGHVRSQFSTSSRPILDDDLDSSRPSNGYGDCSPDAGEYENEPVHNEGLVRESDHMDGDEFPERGTTRGLLAKFQLLQSKH